jgi:hypothetical protein
MVVVVLNKDPAGSREGKDGKATTNFEELQRNPVRRSSLRIWRWRWQFDEIRSRNSRSMVMETGEKEAAEEGAPGDAFSEKKLGT